MTTKRDWPTADDLKSAIYFAKAEADVRAAAAFTNAKKLLHNLIVSATQEGRDYLTVSGKEFPPDSTTGRLLAWLKEAGVDGKFVSDQRDGDYLQLKW